MSIAGLCSLANAAFFANSTMGRRATPENDADIAAYLEAALEDGDPALVAAALGDIARAKGMSEVARETSLGRESLYKALSPDRNPEFASPFPSSVT